MKDHPMPRAQKHPFATRYQLEKLRLDVALKRERLAVVQKTARKPLPLHERPRPRNPEIDAIYKERDAVQLEIELVQAKQRLNSRKSALSQERQKLESTLIKTAKGPLIDGTAP